MPGKNLFLTFLSLLIIPSVYSQAFRYLTIDDGLSSNQVFQIKKDHTGFMWFVTYMGIDRFDGSKIRHYQLSSGDYTYDNYATTTQMVTDKEGEIWIAIQSGRIFCYNKKYDAFDLALDLSERTNFRDILVTSVFFDTSNRLWICSNYGLHLFTPEKNELRLLAIFNNHTPTRVIQAEDGKIYVGTNQYICKLEEKENESFTIIETITFGKEYGRVESLFFHKDKLYIGTESGGVFIYYIRSGVSKSLYPFIPGVVIRSLNKTHENRIMVGTDGSGVYGIDADTDRLVLYLDADDNPGSGLSSNSIYDMYVDETDCLWISTFANGVNIMDPLLPEITYIRHDRKDVNSLVNNQVNAVFEDSDGDIWYGTNNGVSLYHTRTGTWEHYLNNWNRKAVVISFCEDSRNRIWVGGYGIGAYCIDKKTGHIETYQKNNAEPQKSIGSNYIYGLYAEEEYVWMGGLDGPVTQYNFKENTWAYHNIEGVGWITPINDSVLICANPIGFCLLNKNTHHFKQYMDFHPDAPNTAVRRIYLKNPEEVWIATEGGGVVCFNPLTEAFRSYTTANGLPSNYICSIEGDSAGRIWITTERALCYLEPDTEKIIHIGEYIGLNNQNYNPYASVLRKNNHLIFGTSDGAIEFSSECLTGIKIEATITFTDFRLFYNSVKAGEKDSPLKSAINETSSISLAYNQNSFSFVFSSINFRYPKQVVYHYMLAGFDEEWVVSDDENNTVSYTNINPGKYTFRLRAVNKDTKEVLQERHITLHIHPPFWQSSWAWIIYVVLAVVLLRFIVQYIKNKIERRNSREKVQFFISMAHDIRTPVTLIRAPLNDIAEKESLTENGQLALDIARRNTERLFAMITQLLDFEKADLSSLRLIVTKNELKQYIREKVILFAMEAERKHITLTADIGFDTLNVWFDKEKMDKILDNLLTNAIKYTPAEGTVSIKVTQDDKHWYLFVADTGIGIPASEQKYLFKRFFRARNAINSKETGSGIGLLLTMELVKLHHGNISFTSREGFGTEFKLTFRKGDTYFEQNPLLKGYQMEEPSSLEIQDEAAARAEESLDKEKIKILVVEDNDDMRTYLKSSLSMDYQVRTADNGKTAMEIIPELHPDLIISDIMMPELKGDEMCMKLKNAIETSHIPIILLTALNDKGAIIKGLDCGADDYVTKPFDIAILKARIRNLLKNRQKMKDTLILPDASPEEVEYPNPLDKEFMDKVIAIIEENLDNPEFSINDFCLEIGMSRSSLYNKLKALTGHGPNDFIRIIRLNKAKELLLSKRYNVIEASIMTGFSDSKYFSTAFKKQFGVSPSKVK